MHANRARKARTAILMLNQTTVVLPGHRAVVFPLSEQKTFFPIC